MQYEIQPQNKHSTAKSLHFSLKNNTLGLTNKQFMDTYYLAWKILGVVVVLFLAYTFFVARNKKEQG
jgi:hypothetical protein